MALSDGWSYGRGWRLIYAGPVFELWLARDPRGCENYGIICNIDNNQVDLYRAIMRGDLKGPDQNGC